MRSTLAAIIREGVRGQAVGKGRVAVCDRHEGRFTARLGLECVERRGFLDVGRLEAREGTAWLRERAQPGCRKGHSQDAEDGTVFVRERG